MMIMDIAHRRIINRLLIVINQPTAFNILYSFFVWNSNIIFQYLVILDVYIVNLLNHSTFNHLLSDNNLISFFLSWDTIAPALRLISLQSLQKSYLVSLPHLKHFMLTPGYMVNFHKPLSLCLNLSFYVT